MRLLLLLPLLTLLFSTVYAQPEPCGVDEMTSTCLDACVVCDIDGFTGRNNLTIQGQTFPGFCTTIFHNMSYIAFIAGTENLTIDVAVSNCNDNNGLEIGIFESLDCSTFTPVTDCNTDVPANGTARFTNSTPLVIGQHYYLIMDGSRGDICDWTFSVVNGSTLVGDLTTSGIISGPQEICSNLQTTYSTTVEVGATIFEWSLNGAVQNSAIPELDLTFPADGSYELCVTASNVCDEAPQSCTTIQVSTASMAFQETICANECVEVAGETICETGLYQFSIPLADGCDSIVVFDLTVLEDLNSTIDVSLCLGESFTIGGSSYSTSGNYNTTIQNLDGCDSIVTLNLTIIDCELIASITSADPVCNGDANGSIQVSIDNGIAPFQYEWRDINNPAINGGGTLATLSTVIIENLSAGIFEIYISDSFCDDIVFIHELLDPPVITTEVSASDYNGFNLSCSGSSDGEAVVLVAGGIQPYTYGWSNGETTDAISNLAAGSYSIEIEDGNGCRDTMSVWLIEPDPIMLNTEFVDPSCEGLETGAVRVESISGGTLPYSFTLNGDSFNPLDSNQGLGSGTYELALFDANGCSVTNNGDLIAPEIPFVFVGSDKEVELGDEVLLTGQTGNSNIQSIRWSDVNQSLRCDTCLSTFVRPLNDTEYVLSVTSPDGCTTTATLFVRVIKDRNVYAPTAFSPNGDGVNDIFFLFSDRSVSVIRSFTVFNRWGDLIYQAENINTNIPESGWGGSFKGRQLDSGVFVWTAEVEFIDGVISVLSGDVSLIK